MNRIPRIAAIQDLSGLGRCSLAVIAPILSVMGGQCCPLPTAVLSANTAYPPSEHAAFRDLTPEMRTSILHWVELGVRFDAIYSGFLGSADQIGVLHHFIDHFHSHDTLLLVDPVMGDEGKRYRTYTPEMCRRMEELAARADLITPNLTEAAILLGEHYADVPTVQSGMERWLTRLSLDGRRSVVITGVSFAPGTIGAGCFDAKTGKIRFAMARHETGAPGGAGQFGGTGDVFAAVTLGSLLQGDCLESAVARAVTFTQACVAHTLAAETPPMEGVQFEPLLRQLLP